MRNFELKTKHASWLTVIWIIACLLTVFDAKAQTVSQMEYCDLFTSVAEKTMQRRLDGTPMEEMLEYASGHDLYGDLSTMIRDAYTYPQVNGRQAKAAQAFDFGTKWYAKCTKMMVNL